MGSRVGPDALENGKCLVNARIRTLDRQTCTLVILLIDVSRLGAIYGM